MNIRSIAARETWPQLPPAPVTTDTVASPATPAAPATTSAGAPVATEPAAPGASLDFEAVVSIRVRIQVGDGGDGGRSGEAHRAHGLRAQVNAFRHDVREAGNGLGLEDALKTFDAAVRDALRGDDPLGGIRNAVDELVKALPGSAQGASATPDPALDTAKAADPGTTDAAPVATDPVTTFAGLVDQMFASLEKWVNASGPEASPSTEPVNGSVSLMLRARFSYEAQSTSADAPAAVSATA